MALPVLHAGGLGAPSIGSVLVVLARCLVIMLAQTTKAAHVDATLYTVVEQMSPGVARRYFSTKE